MKSFTKFCLILAGVFVFLGIVGVTAGMALGAKPGQFLHVVHYRNSGWPWWGAHADLVEDWQDDEDDWMDDSLEDLDTWSDEFADNWKDYDMKELQKIVEPSSGTVDNFEGYYGNADTRKLELELNQSVVKFYTHDQESIWIQGANAKKYLKIEENGDILTLTDHRKRREKPVILEIYLPQRTLEKLEIDLDATMFYAEDLKAEKIDINMGAGEAEVDAVHGDKLEIGLGAGVLAVKEVSAKEKAVLGVGTGEMTVQRFDGGDLELDCGVGSISVVAAGKEGDYNYALSCGIGSLNLNGRDYSGLGNEQTIDNHASKKITMDCGIGEIELKFED